MRSLITALMLVFFCANVYAEKLDEIVVFEDFLGVKEGETVSNVEVINSKKIENLNPSSTVDLLKMISGVSVKSYDSKNVSVDMGGYGAEKGGLNSVVLLNGRRITSPDMSGVDWSFVPVGNIERVEVYKGGNSVLFGDRATGGAINIVTKKPVKSGFALKTEAGSYGMYKGNLSAQYADESFAVMLNLDKYSTDGYRDNSELDTQTAALDATYYHDMFELNAYGNYTDSEYGLPGSVSKAQMEQNGRDWSARPDDGGDDYEYLYGMGAKVFLPKGELSLKADFRSRVRDYMLYDSSNKDKLKSKAFSPFYTLNIEKGDYSNRLTLGMDYIKYDVESDAVSAWSTTSFEIEREMTGFYVSDRAVVHGVVVEAGYRTQTMKDEYKTEDEDKDETENAYNLLLGYNFEKAGSVYVRYDRSFRFPTTDELREYFGALNTEIEPQTADTYEAGYSFKRKKYYADASVYSQKTDNEIFTNPTYMPFSNENIDTKRKGVNLKAGFAGDALTAEAAYSYVDADIDEGASKGNDIPLLSKNQLKTVLGYKCPFGVGVYYFASYYSGTYAGSDYENSQDKLDAYWVSDIKIDYDYKRFNFFVKANNIFNEEYYDYAFRTAAWESYYPAAERNFAAGLTFRY